MHIAGSITEIKGILQTASDLNADAIHFLAPNAIFILAKNKEDYVYAETKLVIGQSVLVPRTTYQNMKLYIKGAQDGFKIPGSMLYGEKLKSIRFTSDQIFFNESQFYILEADIVAGVLKKEVELKTRDRLKTSIHEKLPFLRMPKSSFDYIKSELMTFKTRLKSKAQSSSDNAIRIENGKLVLYYHTDGKITRLPTELNDYFCRDESKVYTFSDKALYLFVWLARSCVCEEMIILPREKVGYGLIEGHNGDMVLKVRTSLKNDIADKIV